MKSIILGDIKKKMTIDLSDFEEVSVCTDSFGNVLEYGTCEYCQRKMPIHYSFNTLLRSYDYKGRIIWRCNDCHRDMLERLT